MQWVVVIALIGLFLSALVIHFSITDGKMSVSDWIILKINHTYFRYKLSRHRYINERDFPKLTFPLPLANDSVQLFAFASAVNRYMTMLLVCPIPHLPLPLSYQTTYYTSHLCLSMETALLSGWKYQLIGPTLAKHFSEKLHRGTSYLEKMAVLQVALAASFDRRNDNECFAGHGGRIVCRFRGRVGRCIRRGLPRRRQVRCLPPSFPPCPRLTRRYSDRDFLPRYRKLLAQRGVQGAAEGNLTVFNAEQKCSPYKNLGDSLSSSPSPSPSPRGSV